MAKRLRSGKLCINLNAESPISLKTKHKKDFQNHRESHKDTSEIKLLRCDLCTYTSKNEKKIVAHERMHTKKIDKDASYMCELCVPAKYAQLKFKNRTIQGDRVILEKYGYAVCPCNSKSKVYRQIYKCDSCTFKCKRRDGLKRHKLFHKDQRKINWFKCDICTYKGTSNSNLSSHKRVHRTKNDNDELYMCDVCAYKTYPMSDFQKYTVIRADRATLKKNGHAVCSCDSRNKVFIKVYKCDSCTYQNRFRTLLIRHKKIHKDPSEIKWFGCDLCAFRTNRKGSLQNHLKIHTKVKKEKKLYKCDMCTYETYIKYSFQCHSYVHKDPATVKKYGCEICSYRTWIKSKLSGHMRKHKNIMVKCDVCSFTTKYRESLNLHQLLHVDPSEVTKYKCDICSFSTIRKRQLSLHIMVRHMDQSKIVMHECKKCSYKSKVKKNLAKHVRQRHPT